MTNEVKQRMMVTIVFSAGRIEASPTGATDVANCAAELRHAGYEVYQLGDDRLRGDPLDDFLEALTDDPNKTLDSVRDEVEAIAEPFGGDIDEWGHVGLDHEPFPEDRWGGPVGEEAAALRRKMLMLLPPKPTAN